MPVNSGDLLTEKKFFWAWQDEMEEAWLSNMALKGWHLADMKNGQKYTFVKGPSKKVRYCLDYQTSSADKENYKKIFEDAGWEYLGFYSGWQYFRKEYDSDEQPEIFTDNDSKIQRYTRLLSVYVAMMVCLGMAPITVSLSLGALNGDFPDFVRGLFLGIGITFELFFVFLITSVSARMNQLKKL